MSEHLREGYYSPSPPELRLVLLGNIGCGKTSSGDTILSQLSPISPSAARSCQQRQHYAEGRRVTLVEAPRWYWNGGKMEESVRKETERAMTLVEPGPHAILLLVPVSQFTEMEGRVPAELQDLFGENVLDHTLVLLTCGDYLMGRTVEQYLQTEHPGLRQVIDLCGGRYHVINNRQRQDREQVRVLLEMVEDMAQKNGLYHVKTPQEIELDKRVKERKQELMESFRAQKEQRNESLATTHTPNAGTQRNVDEDEFTTSLERRRRRREEQDAMDGRVGVRQVSNGLNSTPATEQHSEVQDDGQWRRSPSFKLNSDGAVLSQMSEHKPALKVITTYHHRINSFEEKSPESSPTASAQSPPVLSYPSATPAFSSSRSTFSSSSPTASAQSPPVPSYSSSTPAFSSSPSTFPSSSSTASAQSPPVPSYSSSTPAFSSSPSTFSSSSPTASAQSPPVLSYSSSTPAFSSSPSTLSSSSPELRLVLLGRSGAGKSAVGNSILGRYEFESRPDSLTAITQSCGKKKALVAGRRVAVVDTPDWFNSEHTPDEIRAQISSCIALSSPGPHAFLLCVPVDQPAKTELQALRALETVFGPDAVQKYTLILFTHADSLRESGKMGGGSVEAHIASQGGDLLKLVEKCRDRFHVMEMGGGITQRRSVAELLEKVEQTVMEAGGECYSSPAFEEAEDRVRQRQIEITKERRRRPMSEEESQLSSERRALYPYMQPLAEAEEEVREDEVEKTREEAERSVSDMNIESLPPIRLADLSPSLLQSMKEKMESSAKMLPKLLADSSVWVGDGAKKVMSSPMWGTAGSQAQKVQKMVADSAVWEKVGAKAGHVSKLVGDRVPKVVVDGSTLVGSRAKAAAASPVWGKVGSGAKLVADGSMRVGAGIGTGAKNLAKSPVWGTVGSGAKSGAKLVADGSMRVGAGIGAGAKKVAQSPVWGKMGSGAKAGAKMVADSSVWEKIGTTAKKVPKLVICGALLGLVLGVFLGGAIGGAVGAAAGSVATEVGRRKFTKKNTDEAATKVQNAVSNSMDSVVKQGEKVLKTE